jgi:hypothetical protein
MTTHSNKEVAMLKKKLILAATGLALTAPAFADHGHRDYRGHGYGHDRSVVVHERYVVQRPVVVREYYRPAPRPVYVVQQPAPVYHHSNAGPALVVGAILGAAIVHSVITSGY